MPVQNKIVTLFQMTEKDMTDILQKNDLSLTPVKLREDINRLNNENRMLKLQIDALKDTVSGMIKTIQILTDEKTKENAEFISRIEAPERIITIPEKEMAQTENSQQSTASPEGSDIISDDTVPKVSAQDSRFSGNSFSFENGTLTIFSCEGFKSEFRKYDKLMNDLHEQAKKIDIRYGITIESLLFNGFNKVTDITLPETIEEIGECAFAECESLERINLPYGLITINKGAFMGCTKLQRITIPVTVKKIEKDAFWGWKADQTIIIIKKTRIASSNWSMLWKSNCEAKIVWNA